MAFKLNKSTPGALESPEALFHDLRGRRIPGLLAHQADVLRDYVAGAVSESDVALQLPTGSGKTLVGLLLGEWRRRKYGERVVYLCPTNQLVNQVAEQAGTKYGIRVSAFTGKKAEYTPAAKSEWLSGEVVGITSYSSLFNVNPFFSEPQLIVLDDAHAAENYIASAWSLRIERFRTEHQALFEAVVGSLRPALSATDIHKLTSDWEDRWDQTWVDKIPTPLLHELIPELVALIDSHVAGLELRYSWSWLRDHLTACQVYLSTKEILIRPLVPPTNTHPPFASATQRVYMSATLGAGGDLERLTGRANIRRLQVPAGWDRQGIGRRLFFFPNRSLFEHDVEELVAILVAKTERAVMLVPDDATAKSLRDWVKKRLTFSTFDAKEIEISKAGFVQSKRAVAVVANRYDGIDFLGDECRLLIVEGLPRATNVQERFLVDRMGAVALLNDRILTRIVQAFGRCTRDATDFALVVVWGDELLKYLLPRDRREFLHPELQAELQFGIDQSKDASIADFVENAEIFLSQGAEWAAAEAEIIGIRAAEVQRLLPGTAELRAAVPHELRYQYAMWQGHFTKALEASRMVLAQLNAAELRGYRALWHYLAGSAAWLAWKTENANLESTAREYYRTALQAGASTPWLTSLTRTELHPEISDPDSARLQTVIERLETVLDKLGTLHDRKYSIEERFILDNLKERDKTKFEAAHERLGRLLGFDAGNRESTGSPDPWWIVDETLCFIFEDHSNAEIDSSLDVTKARQVATHPNWVRENLPVGTDATIVPVLVTPVTQADRDAVPHLKDVTFWSIADFRTWARNALAILRELRREYPGSGDLVWRATAAERYIQHGIAPGSLLTMLRARPASAALSAVAVKDGNGV